MDVEVTDQANSHKTAEENTKDGNAMDPVSSWFTWHFTFQGRQKTKKVLQSLIVYAYGRRNTG